MAGTVFLGDIQDSDATWTAAGWLFDFVITQLAQIIDSPPLAAGLREIVDEHLGALVIRDLDPVHRDELFQALNNSLLGRAAQALPEDMHGRTSALAHIEELVARTRSITS